MGVAVEHSHKGLTFDQWLTARAADIHLAAFDQDLGPLHGDATGRHLHFVTIAIFNRRSRRVHGHGIAMAVLHHQLTIFRIQREGIATSISEGYGTLGIDDHLCARRVSQAKLLLAAGVVELQHVS